MPFDFFTVFFPLVFSTIALFLIAIFIIPAIFVMAWNLAMPTMFRLPKITYWQGFGFLLVLTIISNTLFDGGFGGIQLKASNTNTPTNTSQESELEGVRRDIWAVSGKIDQLNQQLNTLSQRLQQPL